MSEEGAQRYARFLIQALPQDQRNLAAIRLALVLAELGVDDVVRARIVATATAG